MKPIKFKKMNKRCPFCETGSEIVFYEVEAIKPYTTDRGKIISHDRSGVCSKHQRKLAKAIKYARLVALLPFVSR